jgi:hypothetical protein
MIKLSGEHIKYIEHIIFSNSSKYNFKPKCLGKRIIWFIQKEK